MKDDPSKAAAAREVEARLGEEPVEPTGEAEAPSQVELEDVTY
jgi:hypothetical protein